MLSLEDKSQVFHNGLRIFPWETWAILLRSPKNTFWECMMNILRGSYLYNTAPVMGQRAIKC
jgi:hypothetical protein